MEKSFKNANISIKSMKTLILIVIFTSGTIGISLKLATITNVQNVYLHPICYLDWIFLSLGSIFSFALYLKTFFNNKNKE